MTAEATKWLIERGVRMMGIDAITFDPPVWAMFEREQFWEAHRVMWEEEYWHLENLMNLDEIGRPYGFQLVVCRSSGWAARRRRCGRSRSWKTNDGSALRRQGVRRGGHGGRQGSLARTHDEPGLPVPPGFVVHAGALADRLPTAATSCCGPRARSA